ncbi:MAG: hypothetical protein Q8O67_21650 [Deltaproteobacteria bacterium]|nr:hypothetical protein [Deltaproteobacteria bacterium]
MRKHVVFSGMVVLAACANDPLDTGLRLERSGTVDIAGVLGGADVLGLGRDPQTNRLNLLVERRGIIEIDDVGALITERPRGEKGLPRAEFNGVAALGGGRFLLLADDEGWQWDEVTETASVLFCFAPGFGGPAPACTDDHGRFGCLSGAPADVEFRQESRAIGSSDRIFAAPRFYGTDDRLIRASINTYELLGESVGFSIDITELDIDLVGVQRDDQVLDASDNPSMLGVGDGYLVRIASDGTLMASGALDVKNARGLDNQDGVVRVIDDVAQEIVSYDLDELR